MECGGSLQQAVLPAPLWRGLDDDWIRINPALYSPRDRGETSAQSTHEREEVCQSSGSEERAMGACNDREDQGKDTSRLTVTQQVEPSDRVPRGRFTMQPCQNQAHIVSRAFDSMKVINGEEAAKKKKSKKRKGGNKNLLSVTDTYA